MVIVKSRSIREPILLIFFERSNPMKVAKVRLYLKRNSPTIVSCIGAFGVVATTVAAIKATPKALSLIEDEKARINKQLEQGRWQTRVNKLTTAEIIKATWKCYIPTAVIGLSTMVCIFGANTLNKRQQEALASAYILLDNTYKEYKNKVTSLLGEDTNAHIQKSIVEDKYEKTDISIDEEKQLFYEYNYGEFFERTKMEVLNAEYRFNKMFASNGYATLNDFYKLLGLPLTQEGDFIGWSVQEGYSLVDFEHELLIMDDGLECIFINLPISPSLC